MLYIVTNLLAFNLTVTIIDGCRFIRPEFDAVQYGGLSRLGTWENGPSEHASEFTIKG